MTPTGESVVDMATDTPAQAGEEAREGARRATTSKPFRNLARLGLASRAGIYLVLGVLVLLLAAGRRSGETDQRGALADLARNPAGYAVVLLLTVGFACYALWRFGEAAFGVVAEGKGAGPRWRAVGGGLTYAALTATSLGVLLRSGGSSAKKEQSWSARIMDHTGGRWLVGLVGIVVLIVGAWQVRDGVTRGFAKFFDRAQMDPRAWRTVIVLGTVGTTARGVVFAVVGGFVCAAAIQFDPRDARGLDGSLRQVRDSSAGPAILTLFAVGLLVYGLFGLCEVRWRRTGTADQSRSAVSGSGSPSK